MSVLHENERKGLALQSHANSWFNLWSWTLTSGWSWALDRKCIMIFWPRTLQWDTDLTRTAWKGQSTVSNEQMGNFAVRQYRYRLFAINLHVFYRCKHHDVNYIVNRYQCKNALRSLFRISLQWTQMFFWPVAVGFVLHTGISVKTCWIQSHNRFCHDRVLRVTKVTWAIWKWHTIQSYYMQTLDWSDKLLCLMQVILHETQLHNKIWNLLLGVFAHLVDKQGSV